MGRRSKLTEKQWEEIGKRLLAGESGRSLGREYGVSEAAIRGRLSTQTAEIKSVAHQMIATESALKALPISAQIAAHNLADDLRAISTHLAGAAKFGAATAHRLSGVAHMKASEIDDSDPLGKASLQSLRGIATLTRVANEASTIGMNLLSANRETVREINKAARPTPKRVTVDVVDASMPDAEAE